MMKTITDKFYKRFKDPNDVYSAIHPLYYVCALIGLAPYSIKRIENGKRIFHFSLWPIVKSVILVIFFAAIVAYNALFYRTPLKDSENNSKMRYLQEVFSGLLSCCSVAFGCIFAMKIVEVFKLIDEVDVSFHTLAVWVPYKDVYVKTVLHLIFIAAAFVGSTADIFLMPLISDNSYNYGSSLYNGLITLLTVLLPYFTNLLMDFQYFHYLNILRVKYKLLNEYLEALVLENKAYNGWIDDGIATIFKNVDKKDKKIVFNSGKTPKSINAISDPVFIVDQVAALHIKLTDTAHMINYAFCVQQLLRITVAFVSIVTALFWIAVNFSKQDDDNVSELDIFFTFWAFSNACEVMGIVWITSETCEEANTCPRILHKIRNNTTNTKLQDTIEIYSLQMYHNRLSFTVCGLFPLDYTLLYTIVAGVTTYLVILIQFNNADFVKKNNTLITNTTIF